MTGATANRVSIWLCDATTIELDESAIDELLTREEKSRSERFAFEHLRRQYGVGRAALRSILAKHVGIAPQRIPLAATEHGKPYLEGGPHFNVSNSGSWFLIALCATSPVGVDLEFLRELGNADMLEERCFSPWEREQLDALPSAMRLRGFFRCWTRKEAVSKAIGAGLSMDFRSFSVPLDDSEEWSAVMLGAASPASPPWFVKPLSLLSEAESAIATSTPIEAVLRHRLAPDLSWIQEVERPAAVSASRMV